MAHHPSFVARRSRWLLHLINALLILLIGVAGWEAAVVFHAYPWPKALGLVLLIRLPLLCYLVAMFAMRQAIAQLAQGATFNMLLPKLLARVGLALAFGALTSVLIGPLLQRAFLGHNFGGLAAFDPAAIAVGLVGLLLAILARLLEQAAAMRSELDEIF